MQTTINRAAVATATVTIVLALVGCSSTGGASLIPEPPRAAAATTKPTPTAIPGDTDGDGKLSAFEKQVLAQNASRDYTMPDGSIVKIDPKEPLPEAVKAIVTEKIAPATEALRATTNADQNEAAVEALRNSLTSQSEATGKPVVTVFNRMAAVDGQPGATRSVWASLPSGQKSTGIAANSDKDTMIATVTAWAEPRGYEVIVVG
jgi:hypothetical protein